MVPSRFIGALAEQFMELRDAVPEHVALVHFLPQVRPQRLDHPDGAVHLRVGPFLVGADVDHVLVLAVDRQYLAEAARHLLVGRVDDVGHHAADGPEDVDGGGVPVLHRQFPRQDDVAVEDGHRRVGDGVREVVSLDQDRV